MLANSFVSLVAVAFIKLAVVANNHIIASILKLIFSAFVKSAKKY